MALFIKDVLYLPFDGRPQLKKGSLRIEGRRIAAVGAVTPQWGDEIIYGRDMVALPGFVNGHCHAAMTMLRGYGEGLALSEWLSQVQPAEARLNDEDRYWATLLAHVEMLKAGVTCYADMYFDMDTALWALEESGLRAVLGEGLVDDDGGGEGRLRTALDQIDRYDDRHQGRVSFALAPHAVYSCSPGYLRDIAAEARRRDLPLHIHVAETAAEQERSLTTCGKRVLPYLADVGVLAAKTFAAHMIHVDDDEIALAAAADLKVVHCPQSNMKLASGVLPYGKLRAAGITVALGTDGAASNNDLDIIEEMRTAALLQKVASVDATAMPPTEALAMATAAGAEALFLADKIGTLAPGKLADITLISLKAPHFYPRATDDDLLSHLVYAAKGGDVDTVIVNGSIRLRGGRCTTLDEAQICHEVQKRAKRLRL